MSIETTHRTELFPATLAERRLHRAVFKTRKTSSQNSPRFALHSPRDRDLISSVITVQKTDRMCRRGPAAHRSETQRVHGFPFGVFRLSRPTHTSICGASLLFRFERKPEAPASEGRKGRAAALKKNSRKCTNGAMNGWETAQVVFVGGKNARAIQDAVMTMKRKVSKPVCVLRRNVRTQKTRIRKAVCR